MASKSSESKETPAQGVPSDVGKLMCPPYDNQVPCDATVVPLPSAGKELKREMPQLRHMWKPVLCSIPYFACLGYTLKMAYEDKENMPFSQVQLAPPVIMTSLYMVMLTVGPHLMKDVQPFSIQEFVFLYNVYQTCFNIFCVYGFVVTVYETGMEWWGNEMDTSSKGFNLAALIWLHYNNKYLELLDTAFMLMRLKFKQMSFLHCYHHVLMIWAWYAVCTIQCGGDAYFGAMCNAFIHVLMYSYYALRILDISCPWKKMLTQCQLLQFVICAAHSFYTFYKGNAPVFLGSLQLFVMVNMLVLFGQFYYNSYMKKKPASAKKVE